MAVSCLTVRFTVSCPTLWFVRVIPLPKSRPDVPVSSREGPSSAAEAHASCIAVSSVSPSGDAGFTEIATSCLPCPMAGFHVAKVESQKTKGVAVPTSLAEARPAITRDAGLARRGCHAVTARPASSPSRTVAFTISVVLRFGYLEPANGLIASCPTINGHAGSSCKQGFRRPLGISEDGSYGSFSCSAYGYGQARQKICLAFSPAPCTHLFAAISSCYVATSRISPIRSAGYAARTT